MISFLIFVLHVALAVVLGYRGRKEGASGVALGVSLVVLLFAIGWTLATFVIRLVWPEQGIGLVIDDWADTPTKRFLYREITADTASLVLLTLGELLFYFWYLRRGADDGSPGGSTGP
ncbi:MAG: hypothetical protein MUE68_02945 [Bacteroidetes bacterium]|jgi:hypothetical protein|nr:hypothetical protein [Bacteroidota bacterium]